MLTEVKRTTDGSEDVGRSKPAPSQGGHGSANAAESPGAQRPKKPAAAKPRGGASGGSSDGSFESVHARDEVGRFTSGPDRNRGPQQRTDRRKAEDLLRDLGYWRSDMTYEQALARAKANLGVSSDGDLLSALRAEARSIDYDKGKGKGRGRGGRSGGGSGRGKAAANRGARKKAKAASRGEVSDTPGARSAADTADIPDPHNLADGPLTPDAGRWGKSWPPQWGPEPPKEAPGGLRRAEGYPDGSAVYEGGIVWDPDTREFRMVGAASKGKVKPRAIVPSKGPKGAKLLARYADGSGLYEGGIVWDPSISAFRKRGNVKKPAPARKDDARRADTAGGAPTETIQTKEGGPAMDLIEHKAQPVNGFKVLSADEAIVECIVSVTGIKDNVDDIIEPGAYEKTLQVRTPKGVYSHDWDKPVAKTLSIRELLPGHPDLPATFRGKPWPSEAGALVVKCQFNLATERGRDAYEDVKFYGDEQEWSIGYNVPAGGSKTIGGVRRIKTIDLFEFSPVLFGAMPMAGTVSVKSAQEAWRAVKDIVGGREHGIPEREERLHDLSGFTPCGQHSDQPGEVRAKCIATGKCALVDSPTDPVATEEKEPQAKSLLLSAEELAEFDTLKASL